MLQKRVMPCLLLMQDGLYKTVQFKKPVYIGDPINAIKIFNDKEVDELILLDITSTEKNIEPNYELIQLIASECFMPLAYGGGIKSIKQAKKLFELGVEKVSLNSAAIYNPNLISELAAIYGNQAVIVSVDYKKNLWGKWEVFTHRGKKRVKIDPVAYCKEMANLGAGEILLTSIDKEGTWMGFDTELIQKVSKAVDIPVVANGGCGTLEDIKDAFTAGADAVTVGSMAVYQKKGMGVLINFPKRSKLEKIL